MALQVTRSKGYGAFPALSLAALKKNKEPFLHRRRIRSRSSIRRRSLSALRKEPFLHKEKERYDTIRYDTRCYFNVRSKADMSQLNLPHGTDN